MGNGTINELILLSGMQFPVYTYLIVKTFIDSQKSVCRMPNENKVIVQNADNSCAFVMSFSQRALLCLYVID